MTVRDTENPEFTKVHIKLVDGPYATESPWVSGLVVDPDNDNSATAHLANTCFHVNMAYGDVVGLTRVDNERWQVTDLIARNPKLYSWALYLVTRDELDAANIPDEMTYRARYVEVEHAIGSEFPEVMDYLRVEGALGVAPMVILQIEDAPASIVEKFVETLEHLEANFPVTVFNHTDPEDIKDEECYESIMSGFSASPLEPIPVVQSSYKAADDPFWAETFPEDTDFIHDYIDRMVTYDSRVARDLEAGRHDRVLLLLERLMTDPQDLAPLEEPIWSE